MCPAPISPKMQPVRASFEPPFPCTDRYAQMLQIFNIPSFASEPTLSVTFCLLKSTVSPTLIDVAVTSLRGPPSPGLFICGGRYEPRFCIGLAVPMGIPTLLLLSFWGSTMFPRGNAPVAAAGGGATPSVRSLLTGLVLV